MVQRLAPERAAIVIQAVYRGYRLRCDLHEQFAAIRIQALVRGYLARCKFDRMLEDLEAELAALEA